MFRPAFLAVTLVTAVCASAGLALAATSPASDDPRAQAPIPPTGTLQMVLRPQSFKVVDNPPQALGRRSAVSR